MLGFNYLYFKVIFPKILAEFYIIKENNNREKCHKINSAVVYD